MASAFSAEMAAVQLLARSLVGDDAPEAAVLGDPSVFQVGDLREPLATATAGVPFPTLRTR